MNSFLDISVIKSYGTHMIVLPEERLRKHTGHPLVRKMYLTDIGFYPRAEHHLRTRKEGIDENIYFFCTEGKGTICLNGKETYHLEKNQAFCIPASVPHRYFADDQEPWSIYWVHFCGEDTRLFPIEEKKVIPFTSRLSAAHIPMFFDLLFYALEDEDSTENFIYMGHILSLILCETYFRNLGSRSSAESSVKRLKQKDYVATIISFMHEHLFENLTLESLSAEFMLSSSYLHNIFKQETQHSPIDYFIRMKIQWACTMLKCTTLHISEISQQLGYRDPYYFSRLFKKVMGVSPREYKDSN